MKIFVLVGEEERGPYTRSEIFALMKDGGITADTLGRWEQETEWKPINKILAGGSLGLFSAEEIAKKQEELPESVPFVTDLLPPRQEAEAAPPPKSRKAYALALVAVALAIGSVIFMFHVRRNDSVDHPNLATQSPRPPADAVTPPESTPQPVARTTPLPPSNPDPSSMQSIATISPDVPNSASDVNALEKQPILAESSSQLPPQAVQPSPESVESPQPTFQTTTSSIELDASHKFPGVQFWVSQPVESPQGVLILCLERKANAQATAKAPVWLDYAKSQNLALIAFTPSYVHPEKVSAEMLFDGLARAGLGRQPLLVYGLGEGGTFVSSLVNVAGGRINSWAVFTDTLHTVPYPDDKRPALIGCDYEVSKINPNILKAFEAGRDRDLKWTWLSVVGKPEERVPKFQEFVRGYFSGILANGFKDGAWVGTDTLEKLSYADLMSAPRNAAWLPNDSLIASWKQLMPTQDQRKSPIVIRKSLATKVKRQPQIDIFLRLPPQYSKEHPLKGTLAFCTWQNNPDIINKALLWRTDMKQLSKRPVDGIVARLIRYAEAHDLAVLTWTTSQVWSVKGNSDELKKKEEIDFDRTFDKLANVWENGVKFFAKNNGMPENDMLLYGISRGAQWAHRLVLRKPSHFLAVHVHIPSTFDSPLPQANRVLWLVTTGELEPGYERAIHFFQECRALNYPIVFKAIMGLGHDDSAVAENLGYRFFDYALSMRDKRDEIAASKKNPLDREHVMKAGAWKPNFEKPPFVGDLLNQDIFSLAEARMVPVPLQVPLPTEGIAQAWDKRQ